MHLKSSLSGTFYSFIANFFKSILDFLYPPYCYTCEQRLRDNEKLICELCWKSFKSYKSGIKIDKKDLHTHGKAYFNECYSIYRYNEKTLNLIHIFKYYRKASLSVRMGHELGTIIKNNLLEKKYDLIIPIPLHKSRERERGFNQSSLLAKQASLICGLPHYDNIIIRIKNNKSQSQLSYKERIENVKNIFKVQHPEKIADKNIILMDDIITTGLTVNSCCGELKKRGAKNIVCISIIHPTGK